MSDLDIDKILEEIRNHSQNEQNQNNQEENGASSAEAPASDTIDEVMKIVGENEEETAPAEEDAKPEDNEVVFSLPEEEKKVEEIIEGEDFAFATPPVQEDEEEPAEQSEPVYEKAELSADEDEIGQTDLMSLTDNEDEEFLSEDEENGKKSGKKKGIIIAISIILLIAIGAGVYFGFFYKKDKPEVSTTKKPETTQESTTVDSVIGAVNPLTGEAGFNESALGKRPVAVVVENEYSTASVKPQWGMNKADIVLEGESEFSTRLLLFWADYTNMPEQIGPTRSARPPFIRFSQLFDSIFIHAGLSKSKGGYIGANTVFQQENVDHINLLRYSENGTYFGRDKSRTSTIEHTGYLNGKNTAELITKAGINTKLNSAKFTNLEFNKTAQKLSSNAATSVSFKWSGNCPKKGDYFYDETSSKYSTNDFDSRFGTADLKFENLVFLLDTTEYVVKANYKGSGNSETYCNYDLAGGKGTILSEGTSIDITWGVSNGKLWMKDSSGKSVALNPGKTYIGYGSSNHGGSITLNSKSAN
ncbi:MAG: DUF3048 domain-containing protein [Eubacterium sp.]|nr:DUF3048 domain-containing protein [Eubacterium sp.]